MSIIFVIAYPILVHLAVTLEHWWLHGLALIVLSLGVLYPFLRQGRGWAWLLFILLTGLAMLLASTDTALLALYVPPVLFSAAAGWFFLRTLLHGNTPLITNFASQLRDDMPAEISRYTHRCTVLWTVLLFGMSISNLLLAIFADEVLWSLFANFLNYLILVIAFVLEYVYRIIRFRHLQHPSLSQFIRGMARMDWKSL